MLIVGNDELFPFLTYFPSLTFGLSTLVGFRGGLLSNDFEIEESGAEGDDIAEPARG